MASQQFAAKASHDFRRQLGGYGLTTAQILYRLPDHPSLLQTYVWQDYDLCPCAQPIPGVLAGEARGTTVLGHGCALALDQARRATLDQRRVPVALTTSLDRQMRFVARPRHIFQIGARGTRAALGRRALRASQA
jgi:hypothetical protein